MKSVNFVVIGEQSIASDFGKKGTETDLTLFDRKESDIIRTWVVPNGFPEKIQPLFEQFFDLHEVLELQFFSNVLLLCLNHN